MMNSFPVNCAILLQGRVRFNANPGLDQRGAQGGQLFFRQDKNEVFDHCDHGLFVICDRQKISDAESGNDHDEKEQ
jgi:hypothetical protein